MDEEDKLSRLPDELLVSILSLISYKEAATSNVLSSRWKKVWTFIPVLDLDGSSTLLYLKEQQKLEEKKELVRVERCKYVNCVNSVLDSYQGSTIEEFRVRFDLDLDNSNDIQRWVNFAFEKKVQRLVLDLHQKDEFYFLRKMCRLIPFPPCNTTPALGTASLRVVQFTFVDITGEEVGCLLSTCCFLEHLSVNSSNLLVDLKVDIPLPRLKYLDVTRCFNIRSIDITAPNLLTFRCYGPKFNISFEKIPKVTQVFFGQLYAKYIIFENPSILSNYFTQLETLALDLSRVKIPGGKLAQFPKLSRLKNLELAVTCMMDSDKLLFCIPLMKCSAWLQTFKMKVCIRMPNYGKKTKFFKGKKGGLKNLKLVEIIGFRGCSVDNGLISYLIENAVMLEKFIIDPREPNLIREVDEHLEVDEIQVAREKAAQLKHKFPCVDDKLLVL